MILMQTNPALPAGSHPHAHIIAAFPAIGKLLCSGLIAYCGLTVEPAAARGRQHHADARHQAHRHPSGRTVAAPSQDPLFCAARKAEAEATSLADRAVTVQTLKNRAERDHRTICEASRHGFAPGRPPSATAWKAAKNVLQGADDLVPAPFKNVTEFRDPNVPVLKNFRLIGSVAPNGNRYYAPK